MLNTVNLPKFGSIYHTVYYDFEKSLVFFLSFSIYVYKKYEKEYKKYILNIHLQLILFVLREAIWTTTKLLRNQSS